LGGAFRSDALDNGLEDDLYRARGVVHLDSTIEDTRTSLKDVFHTLTGERYGNCQRVEPCRNVGNDE
jgi:hypothetical protein